MGKKRPRSLSIRFDSNGIDASGCLAAGFVLLETTVTARKEIFRAEVRTAYVDALHDAAHVHAICEEYRAAATIDRAHDADDARAGNKIACPVQALWSAHGGLQNWYSSEGGPLALWRSWADDVSGGPVAGGHFFPEESPRETAAALQAFFAFDRQSGH